MAGPVPRHHLRAGAARSQPPSPGLQPFRSLLSTEAPSGGEDRSGRPPQLLRPGDAKRGSVSGSAQSESGDASGRGISRDKRRCLLRPRVRPRAVADLETRQVRKPARLFRRPECSASRVRLSHHLPLQEGAHGSCPAMVRPVVSATSRSPAVEPAALSLVAFAGLIARGEGKRRPRNQSGVRM